MSTNRIHQRSLVRQRFAAAGFVLLCAVVIVSPIGRLIGFVVIGFIALGVGLLGCVLVVSAGEEVLQRLARTRRLRSGNVHVTDVLYYTHRCANPKGRAGRGQFALSHADWCTVRDAVTVAAHAMQEPPYSPHVVYRWLRYEDPGLLMRLLQARIPEAELWAYMDGGQVEREAFEFLLGLKLAPQRVPPRP